MSKLIEILYAAMLLALIILTTLAAAADFYDARGNRIGSSATSSEGTTTYYDARGNRIGSSTKQPNKGPNK